MTSEQAKQVIDLTIELLTPEEKWTKTGEFDNSDCKITNEAYTLSCALYLMQLSVMGNYESRNLVMRRVRGRIRRHFFWRQGFHPVTRFNKHRKTTYEDVIFLLEKVRESF